ncbi:MAG: nucleotidyltransferase family protein [bacterium]|nr:nucleotidyltransferase family protein [bacterium]
MRDDHQPARLLLALTRPDWDLASAILERGEISGQALIAQFREADVHPWVHGLLERHDRGDLLDAETFEELGRLRAKVRVDNLLLLARAEQAVELLLQAGVVPVALKGYDLLNRLLPSIDLRTIDDVDLLVQPDETERSLEALERGGWILPPEPQRTHYIRASHHLPLRSPGPVPVEFELHWNLAQEDRFGIDVPGLLERAVPLDVGGRTLRRLEDHDLVAHLLVHHFTHYFDRRLKWGLDLALITAQPHFDWDLVIERVLQWRVPTTVGISLVHLAKLFPHLIPQRALDRLPVAMWRRALTAPLRSSHPLELFRHTRRRAVQLYLAAVMLEKPLGLPGWMRHRTVRESRESESPLESRLSQRTTPPVTPEKESR